MRILFTIWVAVLLSLPSVAQTQSMEELVELGFSRGLDQYLYLAEHLPAGKTPQSYQPETGKLDSRPIEWWCSGFYSGCLWLVYEHTRDKRIHDNAVKALEVIKPNQFFTKHHDLGFMMFCSYGNAYRITRNAAYKSVILQSAASLATRYLPNIQAIQSWNSSRYWQCPVIIDNMMNLELLTWSSANGGDGRYLEIAAHHANTTLDNHFRDDFSSYHVVDYDSLTGQVVRKATHQGAANTSSWSRGQAWALYGYTMMYRETKEERYLDQALGIATFLLEHPNLPEDKVPFWDFDAPKIPYTARDASAAAIIASALLELGQYVNPKQAGYYRSNAEQMIRTLSSPEYLSAVGESGGLLIKHSTGAFTSDSEVDVPIIYGDYYYLEALKRYKDWYL